MAGEQLLLGLGPKKRKHLAPGVGAVEERSSLRVPGLDAPVRRSAPRRQRVALERTPSERLDRRLVLGKSETRRGGRKTALPHGRIPKAAGVVVAPRGQRAAIGRPAQPANLLGVTAEGAHGVALRAQVVVHRRRVPGSGGQDVLVPRKGTHARAVAVHGTKLGERGRVPQLGLSTRRSHGHVSATRRPRNGRHIVVAFEAEQLVDVSALGVPEVHALAQGHREHVAGAPGKKVEVVVVQKIRSVENTDGCGGDVARGSRGGTAGRTALPLAVKDLETVLTTLLRRRRLVAKSQHAVAFSARRRGSEEVALHHFLELTAARSGRSAPGNSFVLLAHEVVGPVHVHRRAVGNEAVPRVST